jgi:hypothetical protein
MPKPRRTNAVFLSGIEAAQESLRLSRMVNIIVGSMEPSAKRGQ